MATFLRKHLLLSLAFAVAVLATGVFLARFTAASLGWGDPVEVAQPIAGWMTPRYVARSWDVPPSVVAEALGIERDGTGRRITLEDIAAQQGRDLDAVIAALEAAIAAARDAPDG